MRRDAASAVAVLLAVLSLGAILGVRTAAAGGYVPSDETRVQNLVNATRASEGLGQLKRNDDLVGLSRRQADKMAAKGSIFHNNALGAEMTASGLPWQKAGENVGMGPDVNTIEDAFLASPHHYENIVDPAYDTIGIGVVDGADGRRYVVQVFADLKAQTTSAAEPPAPQKVAPVTTAAPQAQTAATAMASATSTPSTNPAAAPSATLAAAPAQAPAKLPSADPNVVIGGVVGPLDLSL